jgi:8-oxo-dGTP pyrophosphatase MutT (NUDIX family)
VWGEYLVHPGAVAVLAVAEGEVLLVRQFRGALGQWTLEVPAGTLEPGEDPAEAAIREMVEETGFKPLRLEPLLDFYPTPRYLQRTYNHLLHRRPPTRRRPGERPRRGRYGGGEAPAQPRPRHDRRRRDKRRKNHNSRSRRIQEEAYITRGESPGLEKPAASGAGRLGLELASEIRRADVVVVWFAVEKGATC